MEETKQDDSLLSLVETNKVLKPITRKKKRSRFFESYIVRILQQVSPENGINAGAKQQLNTILCMICREISDQALQLTEYSGKKTISIKEIQNSLRILISGELLEHSLKEGHQAVTHFEEYTQTKITLGGVKMPSCSRNTKAQIIIPPSIIEKFLRRFNYSKIKLTSNAPVFLAAVIEYITAEILNISSIKTKETRKNRITIRHMELGVRNDLEFYMLFDKLNIKFLGSGFTPGIHREFLIKKKGKKKIKDEGIILKKPTPETGSNKSEIPAKKTRRRYKPGTVALKEIKRYQKSGNLMLARTPFERLVRSKFEDFGEEKQKISKKVFIVLQYFVEQNIIQTLRKANLISLHSGRIKLCGKDILLAKFISENNYNFTLEKYEEFTKKKEVNIIAEIKVENENENENESENQETEIENISSDESSEEEVPTEDSSEDLEYATETDFFTETEMPWAGPKYFKSKGRKHVKI